MNVKTRYGTATQMKRLGVVPALIVGSVSGIGTYILYRLGTARGFKCGYVVGAPDHKDIENAKGCTDTIEEFVDLLNLMDREAFAFTDKKKQK